MGLSVEANVFYLAALPDRVNKTKVNKVGTACSQCHEAVGCNPTASNNP